MGISLAHPAMICCLSKICTRHIHRPSSLTQILQPSHTPRSSHHHHPTIVRKSLTQNIPPSHASRSSQHTLASLPDHPTITSASLPDHPTIVRKSLTQNIPPSHAPRSSHPPTITATSLRSAQQPLSRSPHPHK